MQHFESKLSQILSWAPQMTEAGHFAFLLGPKNRIFETGSMMKHLAYPETVAMTQPV